MTFAFVNDSHKATIGAAVTLKIHPDLPMQVFDKDYEARTFDVLWIDLKLEPQIMLDVPWSCFNEVSGPTG